GGQRGGHLERVVAREQDRVHEHLDGHEALAEDEGGGQGEQLAAAAGSGRGGRRGLGGGVGRGGGVRAVHRRSSGAAAADCPVRQRQTGTRRGSRLLACL